MSKEFGPTKLSPEIEAAGDALFNKPRAKGEAAKSLESLGVAPQQLLDAVMGEKNSLMEDACNWWDAQAAEKKK